MQWMKGLQNALTHSLSSCLNEAHLHLPNPLKGDKFADEREGILRITVMPGGGGGGELILNFL